jgi:hypothetical protein
MVLLEELQGFVVLALVDQGDVALDADVGRTGGLAGGGASFADAESAGNRLGILFENRLAVSESLRRTRWKR